MSKHCEKCNIAAVNCFRTIRKSQQRDDTKGGANWETVKIKSHRVHTLRALGRVEIGQYGKIYFTP